MIKGMITDDDLHAIGKGLHLEDGFSGATKTTLVQRGPEKSMIRMTITSGKKRIIRRLFEALGSMESFN